LKRETAEIHRRLEAQLGLLEPELSIHRYRRVLQMFYGFYSPVEAGLLRLAAACPPVGFPLRARSELLEHDLLVLGLSRRELAELPRCVDLPRLSCPEDLAGCLYVLEGACLGGQAVAPVVRRRFGVSKGSGASFFVGNAEGTPARWKLVLAWLEGVARAGARSEQIVGAACTTFHALAQWVEWQESFAATNAVEGRRDRPDRV
jgi:heme oxygenase